MTISPPAALVDLTRSVPPVPERFGSSLSTTLATLSADPSFGLEIRNSIAGGTERDRRAGQKWLAPRFGHDLSSGRLLLTNGTQSALQLVLEHVVGKDGLLLAEELSYAVLGALADRAHVRIEGVKLDRHGIVPEDFERCCRELKPKALYCNPTIQNPTTALMPLARRIEIAGIARRYGVAIIEDEPLGLLHTDAPPPIASIAPDVTWYVMGLTKCLAHGLRVAYLVGPSDAEVAALFEPVRRLSHWFPAPLATAIATRWIEDGTAATLCDQIRAESAARQAMAADVLSDLDIASPDGAMHLWLRLPHTLAAEAFVAMLQDRSVMVRPASLFAVKGAVVPNAVRLSLSSPMDREPLRDAIELVRDLAMTATGQHES